MFDNIGTGYISHCHRAYYSCFRIEPKIIL